MHETRPRDAQWFRAFGLAILTLLSGMYLAKLPLQTVWSVPEDGGISLGWILAGIVAIPGSGLTLVLAILTGSALRTLSRARSDDNAGARRA